MTTMLANGKEATELLAPADRRVARTVHGVCGEGAEVGERGGGAYGDKPSALRALRAGIEQLPDAVRSRLTLENDDTVYTPTDLLPVCADTGLLDAATIDIRQTFDAAIDCP